MRLGIALVALEVVRASSTSARCFEVPGRLRRARGVALRGRVAGRDLQDLFNSRRARLKSPFDSVASASVRKPLISFCCSGVGGGGA